MQRKWPELGISTPAIFNGSNLIVIREVEQSEEIIDSRAVDRHVCITRSCYRIGEVVTATICHRLQAPVPFDELQDGDMVGIVVRNVTRCRVGRYRDQWN